MPWQHYQGINKQHKRYSKGKFRPGWNFLCMVKNSFAKYTENTLLAKKQLLNLDFDHTAINEG